MGRKEEETVQGFSEVMESSIQRTEPGSRRRSKSRSRRDARTKAIIGSYWRMVRSAGFGVAVAFSSTRQGCAEVLTGAVADITELKRAEQSMAILADASRLLAESLDFEQTLSSMARMAVPPFPTQCWSI